MEKLSFSELKTGLGLLAEKYGIYIYFDIHCQPKFYFKFDCLFTMYWVNLQQALFGNNCSSAGTWFVACYANGNRTISDI